MYHRKQNDQRLFGLYDFAILRIITAVTASMSLVFIVSLLSFSRAVFSSADMRLLPDPDCLLAQVSPCTRLMRIQRCREWYSLRDETVHLYTLLPTPVGNEVKCNISTRPGQTGFARLHSPYSTLGNHSISNHGNHLIATIFSKRY